MPGVPPHKPNAKGLEVHVWIPKLGGNGSQYRVGLGIGDKKKFDRRGSAALSLAAAEGVVGGALSVNTTLRYFRPVSAAGVGWLCGLEITSNQREGSWPLTGTAVQASPSMAVLLSVFASRAETK